MNRAQRLHAIDNQDKLAWSVQTGDPLRNMRKEFVEGAVATAGVYALQGAAKSQMKGKIGMGLRVGGRIGLRAVPVIGVAMIAYDAYNLVKYLHDHA